MSASTRFVLPMRAALVDHTIPYASEEQYFWRFISEADTMTLVERAPELILPPMLDSLLLESCVILVHKDIAAQLAHMPAGVSRPNSESMVQRGIITGRSFGAFVYDMAGRANRYHPGTENRNILERPRTRSVKMKKP